MTEVLIGLAIFYAAVTVMVLGIHFAYWIESAGAMPEARRNARGVLFCWAWPVQLVRATVRHGRDLLDDARHKEDRDFPW